MRSSRTTLVRFLSLIAALAILGTQSLTFWAGPNVWTSIGPDGGWVGALAIDPQSPSTIYAAANGVIFKSTDGGESWKASVSLNERMAEVGLTISGGGSIRLAIDPLNRGTVYAGTMIGVFKTTNGGTTWSRPQMTFPVNALAIDPRSPGTVIAGTATYGGIFRTTDGGATWREASNATGLPMVVYAVAIDPQNPSTVYAGALHGLFKSTDGGVNWNATATPLGATTLVAIDPQKPGAVYARSPNGLLKSTDGGTNWSAAGSGLPGNSAASLAIDPQNAGTVYAGTASGLFKTTNGGTSWSQANSGLASSGVITTLAIDPQNPAAIYAVQASDFLSGYLPNWGLFKTTNGGMSWKQSNSGLVATSVRALAIDPEDPDNSDVIYGVVAGNLLKRTVAGTAWSNSLSLQDVLNVAIYRQDSSILYAASAHGVLKSTDRGATWNAVGRPGLGIFIYTVAIDPQDANTLYAGTSYEGLFKSTDGGSSWNLAVSGLPGLEIIGLEIDPQHSTTIYALVNGEYDEPPNYRGIYKSTNGGASWNAVNDGLPTEPWDYIYVSALTIDPKNSATLYAGTAIGVFKSTNGGTNWSAANSGLTERITSLAIDPVNPGTLYAGTYSRGVFKSTDAGSTWNAVNTGLTTLSVQSLVIDPKDPNRLYAGTDGGGAFAITFVPDLVVTDLQFDRTSVVAGGSFSVNISAPNLTTETFFDVRFTSPGSNVSDVTFNWQTGGAASHGVPAGTPSGTWTINGVRAHEAEADHTGAFFPVTATITVSP